MATKSITPMRAMAGARTTIRVPPAVEDEVRALQRAGATRGAALQRLLLVGAEALRQERADRRVAEALRRAWDEAPIQVPGFPSREEIESAIAEAAEE